LVSAPLLTGCFIWLNWWSS